MKEYEIFTQLKKAYDTTTRRHNKFLEAINSIEWTDKFQADGEFYYCLGKFILTVQNVNPFEQQWEPSVLFTDGSLITF